MSSRHALPFRHCKWAVLRAYCESSHQWGLETPFSALAVRSDRCKATDRLVELWQTNRQTREQRVVVCGVYLRVSMCVRLWVHDAIDCKHCQRQPREQHDIQRVVDVDDGQRPECVLDAVLEIREQQHDGYEEGE